MLIPPNLPNHDHSIAVRRAFHRTLGAVKAIEIEQEQEEALPVLPPAMSALSWR